jgi:pilus assembly protein CpaF
MQDIFVYKRKGIAADGRIIGEYVPTGVRPRFIEKFKVSGIEVPPHIFEGAPS